jgi:DNA polymerase-3 subunit alpha
VELPIEISGVKDLVENEFDGFWTIKGKQVPKYRLRTIIGAVIDKDTTEGTFTLSCPDGVINVKVFKQQFARYAHTLSETDEEGNKTILENSFFDKGTFLAVTGILKGDTFMPKTYRNTGFDPILKIVLNKDGLLDYLMRKAEE